MQIEDSFVEAGLLMPDSQRKDYFAAMVTYLATGNEPSDLSSEVLPTWTAIFPSLKSSRSKAATARKRKSKDCAQSGTQDEIPYAEIIDYLNERCGTCYRATGEKARSLIRARSNDGASLDDFKAVIDSKAREWLNDRRMAKFLRPETLFGSKFETYLGQAGGMKGGGDELNRRFAEYEGAF